MEQKHKGKDIHCGAEAKMMKMPEGKHKMPNGMMMSDKEMSSHKKSENKKLKY